MVVKKLMTPPTKKHHTRRKEIMQITLNEVEIKKAIISFIGNQGISITGHTTVSLIAGRAPNGMSATIDISNTPSVADTIVDITTDAPEATGLSFQQETVATDTAEVKTEDIKEKPLFGKD
jgi:hypothetical protein